MRSAKQTTAQGFRVYAREGGGRDLRVVESSLATSPHVWIRSDGAHGMAGDAIHLRLSDARLVIDGLERFVAEAEAAEARKPNTNEPDQGTTDERRN